MKAHVVEGLHDEVSAESIVLLHCERCRLAVSQGFDRGFLADAAGAEHRVLVNPEHGLDHWGGPAGVANAEPGHREGLGESVKENRPLLHSGKGGNRLMRSLIGEFGIDLVGDHDQVVFTSDFGDGLELVFGQGSAGRVGRKIQDEHSTLGSEGSPNRFRR